MHWLSTTQGIMHVQCQASQSVGLGEVQHPEHAEVTTYLVHAIFQEE